MGKKKILLFAVVLALFMTACGSKEPNEASAEPTVSQEAEATPTPTPEATPEPANKEPEKEVVSTPAPTPEATEEEIVVTETLGSVLAAHNMKAGTCLSEQMLNNKKCTDFILQNFNSITFENHLKPDYILDQKASKAAGDIVVKFGDATINMLQWCADNNMAVRGHTLIWHSQTPDWIFYEGFDTKNEMVSRDVMLARMESYIRQTFELLEEMGYLEMFYAYDVVNEAWEDDGTKRNSKWLQTIGEDYLWQAFYFADKYAPDYIDLYYNDFNEQFKTETLYNFVQTLVDEDGNYLIDGVGFQAHLYTEDDLEQYFHTVERLGSTGLKVCLTELDICLGSYPIIKQPTEENLKAQGQHYYNLLNGLFALADEGKVNMDSLTYWGFVDQLSWRRERSPMLLGAAFKPKYAYYGALQMKEYAGFDE